MHLGIYILAAMLTLVGGRIGFAEPVTVLLERDGIDEELLRLYQKVNSTSLQTKFIRVRKDDVIEKVLIRERVFVDKYPGDEFFKLLVNLNLKNKGAVNPKTSTIQPGLLIVPDFQVRAIDRLERISSDQPLPLKELLTKKEAQDLGITQIWTNNMSHVERLRRRNPNLDRANPGASVVNSVTIPKEWVSLVIPTELQAEISRGRKREIINSRPLHWNSWIVPLNEDGTDGDITKAEAGNQLEAGKAYKFYVDLSPFTFTTRFTESSGTGTARSLEDALQDAAAQRNKQLTVLVIPHSNALGCKSQEVPLEFNFHGLISLVKRGWTIPSNLTKKQLMDDKAALAEKRYTLARASFGCEVRNDADNEKARISFIVFDGDFPVEDFSIAWNVGAANTNLPRSVTRPRGASLLESMLHAKSDSPELSLSILDSAVWPEDSEAPTVGILRATSAVKLCGNQKFCTWLSPKRAEYIEDLRTTLGKLAEKPNNRSIVDYGRQLIQNIIQYPYGGGQVQAPVVEARAAFNNFITGNLNDRISALENNKSVPPLIIVRAVPRSANTTRNTVEFVVPIGMIPIEAGENGWLFIGQLFRTNSLLPYQRHDQKDACQNQWSAALPRADSGDDVMKAARQPYQSINSSWLKDPVERHPLALLKENLTANRFLGQTTVAILAHHGTGDISYRDTGEVLNHQEINATFGADSIVMLNGCGTAVPSESQILRRITDGGVGAAIATTSSVHGGLAGSYFTCFQQAMSATKENLRLSVVHYNALRCLYTTKSRTGDNSVDNLWGAHAFKYVLIGNGNLHICEPVSKDDQ